ncbi:MAG: Nramp family divalent metal transporter [Spirochaetia bacterium]|jgi:manganese transport protein
MKSKSGDQKILDQAQDALSATGRKGKLRRLLPFLGPAFIASVAYMDPGNFATNIQGGAQYGYMLLWVIVASNLIAMLVQMLSAKLGIASGKNLAEHCREQFRPTTVFLMWLLAEVVAMATDLAEFLGAALGFYLLFGIPLWIAGLLTAVATFIILSLERFGFRPLEAVITALVGVIAVSYLVEMILVKPPMGQIMTHAFVPQLSGTESILLAAGILGATVMPHAIFLHSSLTQNRIVAREPGKLRRLFRFEVADVVIALGLAGLINAAMLIMAASTFHSQGLTSVGTIEEAHKTLEPLLGRAASWVFAVSLLASGLSSAAVGTMAGQVIMQGFLKRTIPSWIRRLVTMIPSLVVIALGLDPTRTLVVSQVVLSFGLPFALIPLVLFTRRRDIMGVLVNRRLTSMAAGLATALVVALNLYLIFQTFFGG